MFAVIKSGGKQYKVFKDNVIKIEKVEGQPKDEIKFDEVMLIGADQKPLLIGTPFIKGASVTAEILDQVKDGKIIVFKKKRRQNYRRKNGHRQEVSYVKIKDIIKVSK